MSEEKNIPEKELADDGPQQTELKNLQPETLEPDNSNLIPQIPEMEVHHHSHENHGKKNWKSYFWEFLMLFLAVFCGFLAENQREHMVEHQREKQYMGTMLEDLNADIPLIDSTIINWEIINRSIDTVTNAITFPLNNIDYPKIYRHLNPAFNIWTFRYNDRTITQLKNSGGFRLIRNKKVANKIIAYDQFNNDAIPNITKINIQFYLNATALRSKIFSEGIISEIFKLYGYNVAPSSLVPRIDSLMKKNLVPLKPENQGILLFEFKNSFIAQKRDYESNVLSGYTQTRQKIQELIKLIQEEYHLD